MFWRGGVAFPQMKVAQQVCCLISQAGRPEEEALWRDFCREETEGGCGGSAAPGLLLSLSLNPWASGYRIHFKLWVKSINKLKYKKLNTDVWKLVESGLGNLSPHSHIRCLFNLMLLFLWTVVLVGTREVTSEHPFLLVQNTVFDIYLLP